MQQPVARPWHLAYNSDVQVEQSIRFREWLLGLRDARTIKKINQRLVLLEGGHLGDAKYFDGIGELRINHGPGYRLYFARRGAMLIVLLCGGDKSSQRRDIELAKAMAKEY